VTETTKGISVAAADNQVYVRVAGRGTFQNGQPLRRFAQDMLSRGCRQFHVDLADCQGMDSTFLGVLAGIGLKLQQAHKGQLFVRNVSPRNMELLQTLGLDALFNVDSASREKAAQLIPPAAQFQKLPDSEIGEIRKPLNKDDTADLMLEAHDNLIRADQRNVARFKDLTRILREDVEKRSSSKKPDDEKE